MKIQEVILRAMAKKITWAQAAEIIDAAPLSHSPNNSRRLKPKRDTSLADNRIFLAGG